MDCKIPERKRAVFVLLRCKEDNYIDHEHPERPEDNLYYNDLRHCGGIVTLIRAYQLTKDKNIIVIPSKNIPQGIAALISYTEGSSASDNEKTMSEEMLNIKSGQVTYAVRDTNMDGKDIKKGDYYGAGWQNDCFSREKMSLNAAKETCRHSY